MPKTRDSGVPSRQSRERPREGAAMEKEIRRWPGRVFFPKHIDNFNRFYRKSPEKRKDFAARGHTNSDWRLGGKYSPKRTNARTLDGSGFRRKLLQGIYQTASPRTKAENGNKVVCGRKLGNVTIQRSSFRRICKREICAPIKNLL